MVIISRSDGQSTKAFGKIALAAKSEEVFSASTIVPFWHLTPAGNELPNGEELIALNETIQGHDDRTRVNPKDYAPGGKYRSIPDLLVTAGHCAYDWGGLGLLVQTQVYVGYSGKSDVNNANFQLRSGTRIATTAGFVKAEGNRAADVAFIELDKPFTGVTPFQWVDTPLSGKFNLGVVGYPGDLTDSNSSEVGAEMFEHFLDVEYDLEKSSWRTMNYMIDTYGGNSGSPVLRKSDMKAIGVHCYGGSPNSASVIGLNGNKFESYIEAFSLADSTIEGVQFVHVDTIPESAEERGLRLPKIKWEPIGQVVGPVVGAVLTASGVGAIASVAANVAIQAAAQQADKEFSAGAEMTNGTSDSSKAEEDMVAHALLAEAALQVALELDESVIASQGILDRVDEKISEFSLKLPGKFPPEIPRLADIIRPTILSTMLDPQNAGKITLQVQQQSQHWLQKLRGGKNISKKAEGSNPEAFMVYFQNALRGDPLPTEFSLKPPKWVNRDIEGLTQPLEQAAKVVIQDEAKKQVGKILIEGIRAIFEIGPSETSISMPEDSIKGKDPLHSSLERVLLAEAVLAAVTQADPHVLQAEGFFDDWLATARDLAPLVLPPLLGRASGRAVFDIIKTISRSSGTAVNNGLTLTPPNGLTPPQEAEEGKAEGGAGEKSFASVMWGVLQASMRKGQ